jgi:hypothetical protein
MESLYGYGLCTLTFLIYNLMQPFNLFRSLYSCVSLAIRELYTQFLPNLVMGPQVPGVRLTES